MKKHIILLVALLTTATTLNAQGVEIVDSLSRQSAEKHLFWSIGVTGGFDRNYHIVDMSYMNEYRYSKYAPGMSYGLQLSFSPLRWLSLRVEGVMLEKNYYRDHVIGGTATSLPDTTINQYVNVPAVLMLNVGNKVRLHAFGGGYWGKWLTSTRRGVTYAMNGLTTYEENLDFESAESQVRDNRSDIGLVWGGGISTVIKRHLEIGVEAKWFYGLNDVQKPYMSQLNPRYNTTVVFQGGLSYWF